MFNFFTSIWESIRNLFLLIKFVVEHGLDGIRVIGSSIPILSTFSEVMPHFLAISIAIVVSIGIFKIILEII